MYDVRKNEFKKILFKRKLTRKDVAVGSEISIETINNWLYRNTLATTETAQKVCIFLNISIDELFDEVI